VKKGETNMDVLIVLAVIAVIVGILALGVIAAIKWQYKNLEKQAWAKWKRAEANLYAAESRVQVGREAVAYAQVEAERKARHCGFFPGLDGYTVSEAAAARVEAQKLEEDLKGALEDLKEALEDLKEVGL
jgi:Tfp pilus assembly protein PilX